MKLTWYGTATIILDIQGEKLLFDPFFRRNKKMEQPSLKEFCDVDYIFNTHPHFDHLCDLAKILPNTQAKAYGTNAMAERLKKDGIDTDKSVVVLKPLQQITTKNAIIQSYPAKHVEFNAGVVIKLIARSLAKFQASKTIKILRFHKHYSISHEIVAYEVKAENKNILILGSAGKIDNIELPKDVDVLVWAYQGRTEMEKYSLPIIEKINPKTIILDHFDDAYPPVTTTMNTQKFVDLMDQKHPKIKVIVPEYKKAIEI